MKNCVINDKYILDNAEEAIANNIGDYDNLLINDDEDEEVSYETETTGKFGAAKHSERRRRTVAAGNRRVKLCENITLCTDLGNPRIVGSMKNGTYLNGGHAKTARKMKKYHGRSDRNKELLFLMRNIENKSSDVDIETRKFRTFQYKFNIRIFSDVELSEKEFLSGIYSLSNNFEDAHKWGIGENYIDNIKFVDSKTATAVLTVVDLTTVNNIKDVCEYVYSTVYRSDGEYVDVCVELA